MPRLRVRRGELSFLNLLPNLMTVGAICAGMTAIRFMVAGRAEMAVALIGVAVVLDGLDGRVARLLRSESQIGAELDSLADFLNFGVAPGFMMYFWALSEERSFGWIAVLVYAVCCVLRLARFNVHSRGGTLAGAAPDGYFTGVPAPAGGLLVMLPIFLGFAFPDAAPLPGVLTAGWMILVGGLMISRLPTFSLKAVSIRPEHARFALVGFVAVVAALLTYPWTTLVILDLAYLTSLVVSWRAVRRSRTA